MPIVTALRENHHVLKKTNNWNNPYLDSKCNKFSPGKYYLQMNLFIRDLFILIIIYKYNHIYIYITDKTQFIAAYLGLNKCKMYIFKEIQQIS